MNVKNILIIHLGGTIGMQKQKEYLQVSPNYLPEKIKKSKVLNHGTEQSPHYELYGSRIDYEIYEVQQIKDSSDISFDDWIELVKLIEKNYNKYDGFICLHGTDTMTYTSSAVSFLIENLNKSVIFTGATFHFEHGNSDVFSNIEGALKKFVVPLEPNVYIYFNEKLMVANRTSLLVSSDKIEFIEKKPCPFKTEGKTKFYQEMNSEIILRKLYPSIRMEQLQNDFKKFEGIVIESFGCGNVPMKLVPLFKEHGGSKCVVMVNISQALLGVVNSDYESGHELSQSRYLISGKDMTTEAAYTKLSFVLANYEGNEVKKMMEKNIRGEIST